MTEHEPPIARPAETPSWDVEAIAQALQSPTEERTDRAFGAGVRLRLGPEQTTELELFPTAGVVRLTGPHLHAALFDQDHPPALGGDAMIFDAAADGWRRRLRITAAGDIALAVTRETAPGSPRMAQDAPQAAERPETRIGPETPATAPPVASEDPSAPPPATAPTARQPRVVFAGRLGSDPRCRTTPREILVCTFPVAEQHEGVEQPTWRTVVTFKNLAHTVQETLRRGMFAEFVAYEHQKARRTRDGEARLETQYYVTAVKVR